MAYTFLCRAWGLLEARKCSGLASFLKQCHPQDSGGSMRGHDAGICSVFVHPDSRIRQISFLHILARNDTWTLDYY